jgi:hypothetical protein
MARTHLLVWITSVALATRGLAQQPPPELDQFLRQGVGLDATQRAAVNRGEAVVKVLETAGRRDIAVFGIVIIPMSRAAYVRRLLDFSTSLAQPTRLNFGVFSNPATVADIRSVTIDRNDLNDFRNCKPNDCNFKLPATEMSRLQEQLVGTTDEQQARASAYARERVVRYINDYRARGDSVLATYDDRGGVRASDAFKALLAESPYVFQYTPALARYLTTYPRGTLDGSREVIYWSQDQPKRLRRTLSLTHVLVYTPPEFSDMTVIAARQLYASHYFEAALELTSVVDRPPAAAAGAGESSYYIVLKRFRFDNLPGGLLNIRGRAIDALRDNTLADLEKQRMAAK